MIKKIMGAALIGLAVLAGASTFTSCQDYDDEIAKQGDQIAKLQGDVSALTATVNSLQSQIAAGAVITSVEPVADGVKVTLSNGQSFTLTNGKDGANGADGKDGANGKDGQNGKDGTTWTIGEDGFWYKDNVKTDYKAVGKDGADGADGAAGAAGADGKDGKYYVPNEETGCFDIYQDGKLVEATKISWKAANGGITAVLDGESLKLYGVEGAENGEVVIALSANLKSLALIPEVLMEGLGVIEFPYAVYVPVDNGKTIDTVCVITAPAKATYRINPENADVTANEWAIINRKAKTVAMKSATDSTNLISIVGAPVVKGGEATFTLVANDEIEAPALDSLNNIVALQTVVEGETITSDYAYVMVGEPNKNYNIIHKDYTKSEKTCLDSVRVYRDEFVTIADKADDSLYVELMTPELLYTSTLDLNEYVETYAADIDKLVSDLGLTPSYTFELCNEKGEVGKPFYGKDTYTDQNKFVTLNNGVMAVSKEFLNQSTRPAVNRTPLVKVTSNVTVDGKTYTVATAYIMVRIVEEAIVPEEPVVYYVTETNHYVEFCAECLTGTPAYKDKDYTKDELNVTWEEVNKNVLGSLDLSYAAFLENYKTDSLFVIEIAKGDTTYTPVGQYDFPTGVTYKAQLPEDWATSTNIFTLYLDSTVVMPSKDTVEFAYKAKNNSKKTPNVGFKFAYSVGAAPVVDHKFILLDPTKVILNPDYLLGSQNAIVEGLPKPAVYDPAANDYSVYAGVRVKGKADASGVYTYSSSLIEHFKEYGKDIKFADDATVTFEIVNSDKDYKVAYEDSTYMFVTNAGVETDSLTFTSAEFAAIVAAPATSPEIKFMGATLTEDCNVLVKVTETCTTCTGEKKTEVGYYYVVFQTMFALQLDDVVLGTYKTKRDTVDVRSLVKVIERASEKVLFEWVDSLEAYVATDYAKSEYNFADADFAVEFVEGAEIIYDTTGADTEASFGECLNAEDTYITWYNMGTDLLTNKYAKYNMKGTIQNDKYTVAGNGKITVLSTANTAARDAK